MSKVIESSTARRLLIQFWDLRSLVTPETQCKMMLKYDDGTTARCVLDKSHNDGEKLRANVPHADPEGRLAAQPISWETIRAAGELPRILEEERLNRDTAT